MTVKLVTVPDVPIVSTGTYQLASGETAFSQEDLAAAVAAANDPAIPAPRLKLGHTDPRFDAAVNAANFDGDPAFGTVQNLRLSADRQTVIGDYCNVPDWLAASLASSYPGRSMEGYRNYTSASGREHPLVINKVALLGTTWPGIGSLADLRSILEQNATEPALAASEGGTEFSIIAQPIPVQVAASIDLGNVRSQFVSDLKAAKVPSLSDSDQQKWWARSVRSEDDGLCLIVDDDAGQLIRVPFTERDGDLNYGSPELITRNYLPVAASASSDDQRVLASWSVRAARPNETKENPVTSMDHAAALRKVLGLSEDADDAAVTEALKTNPTVVAPVEPVVPAAPQIPEGMALVDQATLAEIRQNAEKGVQVAARLAREDRDKAILAAIGEGRFPVSRRSHYEQMWDRDVDGTRTLLTASAAEGGLAPGLVPVRASEVGRAGDGDGEHPNAEAEHQQLMAYIFPQDARRQAGDNGRVRVRQEA